MVVPMDPSDATAVRHLLTATQRFAAQAEVARQLQENQEQGRPPAENRRYRYQFDDFENFDEDSDDERDFRDLSHYTTIDTKTGKVTELWLGIIDVHGLTSQADDKKHWRLSESDWEWLSHLDRLEHFKLTGCGALPHHQLQGLQYLRHISCSECGNTPIGEDTEGVHLPQVTSISLRCGFQPNPAGIVSLRAMLRYINQNLTNLERITIWRLDQQLMRGQIASDTTALQRKEHKRLLADALLEELAGGSIVNKNIKTLELNRCGLNSADFRQLMLETLPKNFPGLQRLSLSSNLIDELPEIKRSSTKNMCKSFASKSADPEEDEASFGKKKFLFRRLRKSLEQIHLSNNPIMEFLGNTGEEHEKLPRDEENNDGEQDVPQYQLERRRQEEENEIVLNRFRRIEEFEKLRDWLRLLPRLSQLGYVSCMHNLMRSTTGDFVLTTAPNADTSDIIDGNGHVDGEDSDIVVPFRKYSKHLQRQIEYYLRINRGGRWLVDGGYCDNDNKEVGRDDVLHSLALWPNILEWSYRTSASGCFLVPLPHSKVLDNSDGHVQTRPQVLGATYPPHQSYPARAYLGRAWIPTSSLKNATALYTLLREGPALCG